MAIVGATGSVGATILFAGLQSKSSAEIYAVVRADRVKQIKTNGISVTLNGKEEIIMPNRHPSLHVVGSLEEVPKHAIVTSCVKSEHLIPSLAGVGSRPVLLLQNGFGHTENVALHHPNAQLHPSSVYIAACRLEDTNGRSCVVTGGGHIVIGNGDVADSLQAAFAKQEVFEFKVVKDIVSAKWQKAAMNCAMNPLATLFRTSKSGLCEDQGTRELVRLVIKEVCEVGKAAGAFPDISAEKAAADIFTEWRDVVAVRNPEHQTSMQADFKQGLPTEVPVLNRYVATQGMDRGVDTPLNFCITTQMKNFEDKRAACKAPAEFYEKHGREMEEATAKLFRIAGIDVSQRTGFWQLPESVTS